MKKLAELIALRDQLKADLRALHDTAGEATLSAEDQARWDEKTAELTRTKADIDSIEKRRSQVRDDLTEDIDPEGRTEGEDESKGKSKRTPELMRKVDPWDGADVRTLLPQQAVSRALKALDDDELTDHLVDDQKRMLTKILRTRNADTRGDIIARRLLVTEHEDYRSAFQKIATQTPAVLSPEEGRAIQRWTEFRAMSIGTDASGGFGVPVLIDPTIMLTAQGHPNDFFAISRVVVITNDEWKGVSSAGVSWSFDGEATAVSDDSPTLAQPNVVAHKAQGFIPFSIEVGMDYPGFASEMSMLLGAGYSELLVQKFTVGSGTGEPFGIVTALDANTNVEVSVTTDGAFGAVDVYNLWKALPIKYRKRATNWMCHTDVENAIRQFGDTGSGGANFSINIVQEGIAQLFGASFRENDYMAEFTGTTGAANLLIVGDWSNFVIAQRAGMQVELVPHLFDVTNNRPTGQRGWFAWARVGSDSVNDLGFRLLQNT